MLKNFSLLVLIVLCAATGTHAQSKTNYKQLDSVLIKAHQLGVFNGNVLIAEKGKITYIKAIGQADASGNTQLSEDHLLHIGSIAKEFNAVGILMLKEQGKLKLDDPISMYLPDMPAWATKVKIRNLLQYTSGIPQSKWRATKGDADNLKNLKLVTALNFEPGSKYMYNNNDVFLQRRIIEQITGLSYADFVQEQIFKPCGITHAVVDPNENTPLLARSFNDQKTADNMFYEIGGWPALTIRDFYKWSEAVNSFRLISPASTQELLIPFSGDSQTGLGSGEMKGNALFKHRHDGTAKNYQALLISDRTMTMILMTNNKQGNLDAISKALYATLQGKRNKGVKRVFLTDYATQLEQLNGQQALALYEKATTEQADRYDFADETTLNEVGYAYLNKQKFADAITVFTYNTKLFPKSGNMFDSLGEAYFTQGNKAKALENYTIALKLDPTLESAKKMLQELKP